jgi:hypothetical protein|tara:strand:+ start:362 stop:913 length:552 start_codon:yes stop_codon:yes gene_type:complete
MIKIWYSNKEFFVRAMYVNSRRENFYLWTDRPTIKTLTDTHVHVHTISDDEHIKLFNSVKEKYSDYHDKLLQKLYLKFNREMENPLSFYSGDKGKQFQSDLKAGKFDINHTSMSVGDIVQLENSVIGCNTHQNEYWIVCHDGFDKLKFDDINQVQFDEIRKKDEEYIPYDAVNGRDCDGTPYN